MTSAFLRALDKRKSTLTVAKCARKTKLCFFHPFEEAYLFLVTIRYDINDFHFYFYRHQTLKFQVIIKFNNSIQTLHSKILIIIF